MKELSVIILNWNGRDVMKEFLPSVVEHTIGDTVELIVADNGSTDGSIEWLETSYPDLRLIKFDRNYGFAEGYNRAIAQTDTPFVLLLNSDVAVDNGWWQPLLKFMKEHQEAGAVQPKILSYVDPRRFEHAGAAGGLLDRLGYPYCRGRVMEKVEEDRGQYDGSPTEIAWASGAAMLVSRDAFEKAGGLDEKFFAHMEEIDLCCRLWRLGRKVYVEPASSVRHLGGGALNYGNPRKTYLNFRNNLLLLHKNLPRKKGKKILLYRRLTDSLAFFLFLAKGSWKDARAILKAHADFRRMRKEYRDFPTEDVMHSLPGAERWFFMLNRL